MKALRMLLISLLTMAPATASADCSCIYLGGNAKLGETACINTAKGKSLARCDMALNNSSWTVLDQPCDVKQSSIKMKMSALPNGG